MPFIAISKYTRERVDITTISNPRTELKSGECICQLCEQDFILKAGFIIRPHFSHYAACNTDYKCHPETPEHLEAKRKAMEYLKETYAEYTSAAIEFEVKVPEVQRVADIMVIFPMGWRIAHEIQLSGITTEQLQERTDDYLRAGIDTIWWLGRRADTPANRTWCLDFIGGCFIIHTRSLMG